jgi:plastocyanin
MLEQLWNGILELTSQLVIPDWGVLVSVALPLGTVLLVALGLVWTIRRLVTAPPARRGPRRVAAATPAGVHMPGPSMAPIFAAIGSALLFLGLVFGGVVLALGVIALILTLLYWLAEGLRVYDHEVEPTATLIPARIETGPPPGVHMPGPSYRPIMGALGTALLFLGLVFGGWLLAVGVFALIVTLIGWLVDARKEYVKTVEADRTGHLENIPAPNTPSRVFAVLAILVVAAAIAQSGVLTTGSANGGSPGASGASGATASGGPGGSASAPSGGGSGAPASAPAGDSGGSGGNGGPNVAVHASGIAFTEASWTGPADTPFTITFENQDAGTPHNIAIKDASGAEVFKGDIFNGVGTKVYDVPALPAGQYSFVCSVHPNMSGTATLQ